MSDELADWAAKQAPRLREQAEAEAVQVLRDALVRAALSDPQAAPLDTRDADPTSSPTRASAVSGAAAPEPAARTPAVPTPAAPTPAASRSPETGELLWAYCVMRAGDAGPAVPDGVGGSGRIERVEADGLVVTVSRVPRAEFGSDALQRNLNDMVWLERTAREHEAVLEAALHSATIVPLRMCTVYENAENAQRMLLREHGALEEALEFLEGRLEWSVKLLVESDALLELARAEMEPDDEPPAATERYGEGGAYMLGRRRERQVRQRAQSIAADVAEQVHARLQDWAIDAVTRPAQNPELSGHEGEMLLNAAYLVERERTEELRRLVNELEAHHRELGVTIELTGPWPPYNFVPGGGRGLA